MAEKALPPTKDELQELRTIKPIENVAATNVAATGTGELKSEEKQTPKAEVKVEEVVKPTVDSLSDDELIAALEKRGKKIATETLTDEQKKRRAETDEVEKRKFAIENLNMTNEQYDEIKNIIATDGTELTKREFSKLYKSENKNATQAETDAAYNDYYNLPQTITAKEKKVKRDERGKVIFKSDDPEEIEEEEIEVPKSKFEEKNSKWGEQRIKTKAERIKAGAKQALDYIDTEYGKQKELVAKANEYSKVAEKVMSEIDFGALPVTYKFGTQDKSKEIKAIVKLDDAAKADVYNYINTDLAQLIINTDKFKDPEEIGKQIRKYVKEKYENQVGESIYNSGYTSGINDGKVGARAPFESTTAGGGSESLTALEKSAQEKLPDNPLHKTRK